MLHIYYMFDLHPPYVAALLLWTSTMAVVSRLPGECQVDSARWPRLRLQGVLRTTLTYSAQFTTCHCRDSGRARACITKDVFDANRRLAVIRPIVSYKCTPPLCPISAILGHRASVRKPSVAHARIWSIHTSPR